MVRVIGDFKFINANVNVAYLCEIFDIFFLEKKQTSKNLQNNSVIFVKKTNI